MGPLATPTPSGRSPLSPRTTVLTEREPPSGTFVRDKSLRPSTDRNPCRQSTSLPCGPEPFSFSFCRKVLVPLTSGTYNSSSSTRDPFLYVLAHPPGPTVQAVLRFSFVWGPVDFPVLDTTTLHQESWRIQRESPSGWFPRIHTFVAWYLHPCPAL